MKYYYYCKFITHQFTVKMFHQFIFAKNNQSKLDKMPERSGYSKLTCRFKANKT